MISCALVQPAPTGSEMLFSKATLKVTSGAAAVSAAAAAAVVSAAAAAAAVVSAGAAAAVVAGAEDPPQAAMEAAMMPASPIAANFLMFMLIPPFLIFAVSCIYFPDITR